MYFLEVSIDFDSPKEAKDFFTSIKPEIVNDFDRSKTRVLKSSNVIDVEISASDKTALRASFNAIYKSLKLFTQVRELE